MGLRVTMLHRKLLRDLARLRGPALSLGLLVAVGVAVFEAMTGAWLALRDARDGWYASARFPDISATVPQTPMRIARSIEGLPGVAEVDARLAAEARVEASVDQPQAALRLLSVPQTLGKLHLRKGVLPGPETPAGVLISEAFAEARQLEPGMSLDWVVQGRRRRVVVTGIALSPEHVYVLPPGAPVPEDRRYGVAWMPRDRLADVLDRRGLFDEVAVSLQPGASVAETLARVDRLLAPWGGRGAIGRSNELEQLRVTALWVPGIFLLVAVFVLHGVLGRLVEAERPSIATLKALGYGNGAIGRHYLELALGLLVGGALAGLPLGARLGIWMTGLYRQFFRFPVLHWDPGPAPAILALLLAIGAAVFGALASVRRVVRLQPAEALQPPAPPAFHDSGLGRLAWLPGLKPRQRLVVRNAVQRPLRFAAAVLGLSLATGLVITAGFWTGSLDWLITTQFGYGSREHLLVGFDRPLATRSLTELQDLPGVLAAEPVRMAPVVLRSGPIRRTVAIQGLPVHGHLFVLRDKALGPIALPADGILLSLRLAQRLGLAAGDRVDIERLEGRPEHRAVRIAGLVDDHLGPGAYADLDAMPHLLGLPPAYTGARLQIDPAHRTALLAALRRRPYVASVASQAEAVATFQTTFADMMRMFSRVIVLFAVVLVAGVAYNGARVALAERARDLTTLRILGMRRGEVMSLLIGETVVQVLAGLPLGLVVGWGLAHGLAGMVDPEMMAIPVRIGPSVWLLAAGVTVASAIASALLVARQLGRLDLRTAMQTRE
jgi:putative ABC transport system permease protein